MKKQHKFNSKWGFLLTSVGSAVGMANVWGFPYKVSSNGGGSFLIYYLIFIALFSYVGLSAEYAIGRRAETGTLGAYEYAFRSKGVKGLGRYVGLLPLLGSICISIGYAVIISYIFKSLVDSFTGTLMTANTQAWFQSFAFEGFQVLPYHFIVIAITLLTCITGAHSIEKANKVMMPLFFVLFVFLAIRVAMLPNAIQGYKFIFTPDLKELTDPTTIVNAMGQAFFSLSITGSGMIVCGAYLSKEEDIVKGAKETALFDTIAAFVAALVMIPALFAFQEEQVGGPDLLFVILPKILQEIQGGQIFAIILFIAVLFGGISSLQNMYEVVCESILHRFPKLSRKFVLLLIGLVSFIPGVFMEDIAHWGPWMDLISIYIIPIGATLGAISWFWVLKKEELMDEINTGLDGKRPYGKTWYNLGRYVYVPLSILLCIIALVFKIAF